MLHKYGQTAKGGFIFTINIEKQHNTTAESLTMADYCNLMGK